MADYHDKRTATVMLGHALVERGWKLWGYHEDQSDSMTDYYCPATWTGVATKGERVACIDVDHYEVKKSGHQPQGTETDKAPCERCTADPGVDPSGWTLEKARAEPLKFTQEHIELVHGKDSRIQSLMPHVISPIPFRDNCGPLNCVKCHGTGQVVTATREVDKGERWPKFHANPSSSSWHVETGGRIVAQGSGVFVLAREKYEDKLCAACNGGRYKEEADGSSDGYCDTCEGKGRVPNQPKLKALADKIDRAGLPREQRAPAAAADPDEVTLSRSEQNADNLELRFPGKPDADIREELKRHKFRWSVRFKCWYGRGFKLPARYHGLLEALEAKEVSEVARPA